MRYNEETCQVICEMLRQVGLGGFFGEPPNMEVVGSFLKGEKMSGLIVLAETDERGGESDKVMMRVARDLCGGTGKVTIGELLALDSERLRAVVDAIHSIRPEIGELLWERSAGWPAS